MILPRPPPRRVPERRTSKRPTHSQLGQWAASHRGRPSSGSRSPTYRGRAYPATRGDRGGLRGVLFDSGDTLIRPIGGRWNPRYDFEQVVLRHVPEIPTESFPGAFAAGQRVLDTAPATASRTEYHLAILRALGVRRPPATLLCELEQPLAGPPVEPFPEVRGVLERLRARGVLMAVVSDNWPTLEDLYRQLGLREFFQTFVISAVLGCRKPDPRMYRAGSDGLGLTPHECVFVDDDPELVAAAIDLGYRGISLRQASRHAVMRADGFLRRRGPVRDRGLHPVAGTKSAGPREPLGEAGVPAGPNHCLWSSCLHRCREFGEPAPRQD